MRACACVVISEEGQKVAVLEQQSRNSDRYVKRQTIFIRSVGHRPVRCRRRRHTHTHTKANTTMHGHLVLIRLDSIEQGQGKINSQYTHHTPSPEVVTTRPYTHRMPSPHHHHHRTNTSSVQSSFSSSSARAAEGFLSFQPSSSFAC